MLLLTENAFTPSIQTVRAKHQWPLEITDILQQVPQHLYYILPWIDARLWPPVIFLVPSNTATSNLMLGVSSTDDGLVNQYTHSSTLWVGHNSPSNFTQNASPSHSIWITTFMALLPISAKASSTVTPTVVITSTYISGYQYPCMLPVITCLVGLPINLTGGVFTTGTGLCTYILYFVDRTTGRWSAISLTIIEFDTNDTDFDALSTSLPPHNSVASYYYDIISHSHIILSGWWHIMNWYCNNLALHLFTM